MGQTAALGSTPEEAEARACMEQTGRASAEDSENLMPFKTWASDQDSMVLETQELLTETEEGLEDMEEERAEELVTITSTVLVEVFRDTKVQLEG